MGCGGTRCGGVGPDMLADFKIELVKGMSCDFVEIAFPGSVIQGAGDCAVMFPHLA